MCFCSSFLMWTGWFSRKLGLKTLNNISCFQCGQSRDCSKRKTSHSALLRFGGRSQEGKKCQIIFRSLLFKSNFVRVLWGLWLQIKCIWLVNAAFQDKFKLFSSNKSFKNMLGEKQIKKSDWGVVFSHNWTWWQDILFLQKTCFQCLWRSALLREAQYSTQAVLQLWMVSERRRIMKHGKLQEGPITAPKNKEIGNCRRIKITPTRKCWKIKGTVQLTVLARKPSIRRLLKRYHFWELANGTWWYAKTGVLTLGQKIKAQTLQ